MTRHHTRRAPKRNGGFSWGRFPTSDGAFVTWRMFRRDHSSSLHMHALTFTGEDDAAYVAKQLRRARRQLRDRVDEIDLAAMGVTA
ncbi:hypothetical protein [Xanthomonas campestris]|uniref:hypothetical protein n=1 Tax=Xanthomonas campestris TaxID=339 RepID=UPI000E32808E|nr:hypothetical protein [Xanthomonas campestris]RFF46218.1 hypothetical protein D0A35_18960 [Xanthomonas campestris]